MDNKNDETIFIKPKRGRPQKYEEGAKQHAIDNKYSSEYYKKNKGAKTICEVCKNEVSKWTLNQHMKSKKCQSTKTD